MRKLFVAIGRFQPMHNAHEELIQSVIGDMAGEDTLLVLVGSANKPMQYKNPYSVEERMYTMNCVFHRISPSNEYSVLPLDDYPYMDNLWEENLHNTLEENFSGYEIVFCSSDKEGDDLLRKDWARGHETRSYKTRTDLSATLVREKIRDGLCVKDLVPKESFSMIERNPQVKSFLENTYNNAVDYINQFSGPFPTQFAATDGIVRDVNGNYLAITRGAGNGEGNIAWPGGHLEINLNSWDNTKKELLEETNLDLDSVNHKIVTSWNCTEPGRSLLRRMTTEVFLIQIDVSFNSLDLKIPEDNEVTEINILSEEEVHNTKWFSDHYGLFLKLRNLEDKG